MILLDTNALIWLDQGHPRARPLLASGQRLYISPASMLELQVLVEAGRLKLRTGTIESALEDSRWALDDPPASACEVCGAGPVEKVLFPVAVHFKGFGFYSTDYGKSKAAKKEADSSSGSSSSAETKSDSKPADSKPASTSSSSD